MLQFSHLLCWISSTSWRSTAANGVTPIPAPCTEAGFLKRQTRAVGMKFNLPVTSLAHLCGDEESARKQNWGRRGGGGLYS